MEDHLYICDIRVNKTATSFDKVGKRSQAVCTKSHAFQHFETRLKINRNVHVSYPHKGKVSFFRSTRCREDGNLFPNLVPSDSSPTALQVRILKYDQAYN